MWGAGEDVCTFFLVKQYFSFVKLNKYRGGRNHASCLGIIINASQGVGGREVPIQFNHRNSLLLFILTTEDFILFSFLLNFSSPLFGVFVTCCLICGHEKGGSDNKKHF